MRVMSKVLLIDIGNSSTKVAWLEGGVLGEQVVIPSGEERELLSALLEPYVNYAEDKRESSCCSQKIKIMISSVSKRSGDLMSIFDGFDTYILKGTDKLPFKVSYKTKETLGPDRVAAIAGAISEYGKRHMLVVDIGTAITLDYYDADSNTFKGGNISPGIRLRFSALHDYTSKLPLVEPESAYKCKKITLGANTQQAILEGVMQGVRLEIEGYKRDLEKKTGKDILLVLTGGDSKYFHSSTKSCTFALGNLVLKGLAFIGRWKTRCV